MVKWIKCITVHFSNQDVVIKSSNHIESLHCVICWKYSKLQGLLDMPTILSASRLFRTQKKWTKLFNRFRKIIFMLQFSVSPAIPTKHFYWCYQLGQSWTWKKKKVWISKLTCVLCCKLFFVTELPSLCVRHLYLKAQFCVTLSQWQFYPL